MTRFQSAGRPNASLLRRELLIGAGSMGLVGCSAKATLTASTTPKLDMKQLNGDIAAIAARLRPAVLGAGLMNLESGEVWSLNGERPFPMQSVFKAPLGAYALSEVDAGLLSLDQVFTLDDIDLSPSYSPIADAWPARRDYTARELLVAAVGMSDNTAADILMRRVGGPGALTAWLVGKKIEEVRVDRYERELQPESVGMASFRPAWKGEAAYLAALRSVPPEVRRAAVVRYLADPRDTATPRGMLTFLGMLAAGELISRASTALLLQIMTNTPTGAHRLKAGLPPGATLAHKTGTARTDQGMNPAINDVGIVTLPDKRAYAAAVFLSGSTLDDAARDAAIADVARAMIRGVG
ncbi:serine hydrolase [Phenylobacterium hankyongense]|uniref:beta-lactamase n=1 Tax=Phenylobacterium hankyongense TaxID=1813876 RepID=A0A328AV99_9CAUL|nr:class A beta-lactamase [Phenylobacterium hankyongense]RAK58537.1 serine hydrolase [Phenylobacterium hankyongense]